MRAFVRDWKGTAPRQVPIGNAGALRVVLLELVCLSAALWIGNIRGWSPGTLGLRISWMGTVAGGGRSPRCSPGLVFSVCCSRFSELEVAFRSILPGTTLPLVLLLATVKPLYEETFEAGYILQGPRDFGMWPAVLASAVFTSFLHACLTLQSVALVFLTRVAVALLRPRPDGAYSKT